MLKVQEVIQYTFKQPALLEQALTHKSHSILNYERLEFLGDSILNYTIALDLFTRLPDYTEGQLTKLRAALVNEKTLAEIAKAVNLDKYIRLSAGELKALGNQKVSILADCLEAIFAAVLIDSNLQKAQEVILRLFNPHLINIENIIHTDYKTQLQEILQANNFDLPIYLTKNVYGRDHERVYEIECQVKHFNLYVTASGKTKKQAGQLAAEQALNLLKNNKT